MSTPPESHPAAEPAPHIIRISRIAHLGVMLLLAGALAPATAAPRAFGWLLLIPVAALITVLRCRTVVTHDVLVTRLWWTERSIPWSSVQGIVFPKHGWARADLDDGSDALLPAVGFDRLRDLADASGGWIPNPYLGGPSTDRGRSTTPDPSREPE